MQPILTQIIQLLVGGLTEYGRGIGSALSQIAQAMFIDTTGETNTLSIFGGLIVVFAAIALGVGLTRLVFGWITSLGARK